jgi:hypothetical protein
LAVQFDERLPGFAGALPLRRAKQRRAKFEAEVGMHCLDEVA